MRVDRDLVRAVEAASARSTATHADALARSSPESSAAVRWYDGAALVALGPGRYVNRAVAFGLGEESPVDCLDTLEQFFGARSLPASAEVSPWVAAALLAETRRRGYGVEWFRNVYAHDLADVPDRRPDVTIAEVEAGTYGAWRAILAGDAAPGTDAHRISDEFCDARHRVPGSVDLVATLDGALVATGSFTVDGTIASIGGAATRPAARGRGVQHALVVERLHRARDGGARIAIATALADGSSARNLAALGFQLLYTQVVLTKPL